MRLTIESVIYFYMFICAALLVFNLLYITRSKRGKKKRVERAVRWGSGSWRNRRTPNGGKSSLHG